MAKFYSFGSLDKDRSDAAAVAFGAIMGTRRGGVGPALARAMEFERREVLTILDDPVLDDWQARARAAGMSEAEIERATKIASKSTAPMVVDGKASEVE